MKGATSVLLGVKGLISVTVASVSEQRHVGIGVWMVHFRDGQHCGPGDPDAHRALHVEGAGVHLGTGVGQPGEGPGRVRGKGVVVAGVSATRARALAGQGML